MKWPGYVYKISHKIHVSIKVEDVMHATNLAMHCTPHAKSLSLLSCLYHFICDVWDSTLAFNLGIGLTARRIYCFSAIILVSNYLFLYVALRLSQFLFCIYSFDLDTWSIWQGLVKEHKDTKMLRHNTLKLGVRWHRERILNINRHWNKQRTSNCWIR